MFSRRTSRSNTKNKEEVATRRRRPNSRKVTAAHTQPTKAKEKQVIDLTIEEEGGQALPKRNEEKHVEVDPTKPEIPMDIPAHLESDDYFTILSLQRSATESDVKRAYRKLAIQWHPDKNRSNSRAEEIFKKISEAYEVLSNSEKRMLYEKYGKAGVEGRSSQQNPHEFGFNGGGGFSSQHARDIFNAFFGGEDPFEAFFGGGRQPHGSRRAHHDPFGSMNFGGMGMGMGMHMGMGMNMHGFGSAGGVSMMNSCFGDGFEGMHRSGGNSFSTSSSSSSSMYTDQNGNVIQQKTTTTIGPDGRKETVTEEYRNGKLVNSSSSSSCGRLADTGRMQLDGNLSNPMRSDPRRRTSDSV
ncbi:hypothetical protein PsorP6_002825 [Peronosclerospora sorghi]|uniref:Uncharacterized protein n=1 Tax=Peronosclerospora sorghi TaxID=230839 RepID=A0ACC0VPD9_9STRA|nr:hypothetical protein PsorP6_002825 [Peronosclerospora sorghi]